MSVASADSRVESRVVRGSDESRMMDGWVVWTWTCSDGGLYIHVCTQSTRIWIRI